MENKIVTLSRKELIREIDMMNKDEFKYVGIIYERSGDRNIVENHKQIIESLKANTIKEFKLLEPLPNKFKNSNFIIINCCSLYVNIYKYEDIKHKIKGMTKHKCMGEINLI